MLKTTFWGTPQVAVPYLETLAQHSAVQLVVSNPDEPSGRGHALQSSPVKQKAQQMGLSVLQPEKLNDPIFMEAITATQTDLAIVVAYGKLIPSAVLSIPKHGFINVHFSLLPAYRGAAPVQRALMAGESQTGVSLFWLDQGMDTGPIFLQRACAIEAQDHAERLFEKLIPLGTEALIDLIHSIEKGTLIKDAQVGTPTLASKIQKQEYLIDWSKDAKHIHHQIRGLWPRCYTTYHCDGTFKRLRVLKSTIETHAKQSNRSFSGRILSASPDGGIAIMCGSDRLRLIDVQPEGKKPMSAWSFWQGARLAVNDQLGGSL